MTRPYAHHHWQLDGTTFAASNCGCAVAASMAQAQAADVDPPGPAAWGPYAAYIRGRMRALGLDGPERGTSASENAATVKAIYGLTLTAKYNMAWSDLVTLVAAGHDAGVGILYRGLHGNVHDACPSFDGAHEIGLLDYRFDSTLGWYQFLVMDSLADGRRSGIPSRGNHWWAASLVKRLCADFAGPGMVTSVLLTPRDLTP